MEIKSIEEIVKRFRVFADHVKYVKNINAIHGDDYEEFPKIRSIWTESLCASLIMDKQIPLTFQFNPDDIKLHGGRNHNDIFIGDKEISIKATAVEGRFTWFSKKDFSAHTNIWIDFYNIIHLNQPILPVSVFYNLGKYITPSIHGDKKIVYNSLCKCYSDSNDAVFIPSVKVVGINA